MCARVGVWLVAGNRDVGSGNPSHKHGNHWRFGRVLFFPSSSGVSRASCSSFVHCFLIVCSLFSHCLPIVWSLFSHCLVIVCSLLAHCLLTVCSLFTHCSRLSRYGVHISNNSYYLCYSPSTIGSIFDRIRTLNNGQVCQELLASTIDTLISQTSF